jgi:hypothetical protein
MQLALRQLLLKPGWSNTLALLRGDVMSAAVGFMRFGTVAALSAGLLYAGCTTMEPVTEQWKAPVVGSTWAMAQHNTGSYGKDVEVRSTMGEGTWQGQRVVTFSNSMGNTMMATRDAGRWIAVVDAAGKPLVSWDPPIGWQYPLSVGKTWTSNHRVTLHAANRTLPFDYTCNVAEYTTVTVPAGTFPAFKIGCTSTLGTEDTYWASSELGVMLKTSLKRTADNPFGAGTQESQMVSQTILR